MTAAAPSGVVTFLFTDIEGSTGRWEKDADGMRTALAAHDEVLRSAIEVHGGWVFKHIGDGVCAAFGSPRSAVDAAVAAQQALELPVRTGIATGEAELREGDYFGAVLNRAARVMAARHDNHIHVQAVLPGAVVSNIVDPVFDRELERSAGDGMYGFVHVAALYDRRSAARPALGSASRARWKGCSAPRDQQRTS